MARQMIVSCDSCGGAIPAWTAKVLVDGKESNGNIRDMCADCIAGAIANAIGDSEAANVVVHITTLSKFVQPTPKSTKRGVKIA